MNREKAKKFMDTLVEVNRTIEENNKTMKNCSVHFYPMIINGLEDIANVLQLTRSYQTLDDGYTIIRVTYNDFDFAEVKRP